MLKSELIKALGSYLGIEVSGYGRKADDRTGVHRLFSDMMDRRSETRNLFTVDWNKTDCFLRNGRVFFCGQSIGRVEVQGTTRSFVYNGFPY